MLPELKEAIIAFVGSNPNSCTRTITQGIGEDRTATYEALCTLEEKNIVSRSGGLDGLTITFIWNLLD